MVVVSLGVGPLGGSQEGNEVGRQGGRGGKEGGGAVADHESELSQQI